MSEQFLFFLGTQPTSQPEMKHALSWNLHDQSWCFRKTTSYSSPNGGNHPSSFYETDMVLVALDQGGKCPESGGQLRHYWVTSEKLLSPVPSLFACSMWVFPASPSHRLVQSKWSDAGVTLSTVVEMTEDPMYMMFTDFQAEPYKKPSVVKMSGECICLISKAQYQGNDHA